MGDVQIAKGDLTEALKSYRDSLAIMDRLAKFDAGNAGWQSDLSIAYEKLGDVQIAQKDLSAALESYRGSLAIVGRLAKSAPSNTDRQSDLAEALNKIGDVDMALGDWPARWKLTKTAAPSRSS